MRAIDADALKGKFAVPGYEYFSPGYIRDSIDEEPTIRPDAPSAHLLTLEEIKNSLKTPFWKETKSTHKDLYTGWVLAYDIQKGAGITGTRLGMAEPNGRVVWYRLDDYGRKWRCWTARPTDEQRKAVKWDAAD